jgi:hypothetical protein
MDVTNDVSDRLVRLPFWIGLEDRFDELLPLLDAAVRGARQ